MQNLILTNNVEKFIKNSENLDDLHIKGKVIFFGDFGVMMYDDVVVNILDNGTNIYYRIIDGGESIRFKELRVPSELTSAVREIISHGSLFEAITALEDNEDFVSARMIKYYSVFIQFIDEVLHNKPHEILMRTFLYCQDITKEIP